MKYRRIMITMSLFTCLAATLPARAELIKTVELHDYLGVTWQHELVHYPLEFARGELKGAAVALVRPKSGPPIPSQVSDIVRHDDGSVKSCSVWFFADVPSNSAVQYMIKSGERSPTADGVTVKQTAQTIDISSGQPQPVAIRLPNGGASFDWPVAVTNVPGPVQALLLPSGRQAAFGRWDVPFRVKSWQAELVASGPLFAEVRVHYLFDSGYWTFIARVQQGCPVIQISEEFDTGDSGLKATTTDRFYSLVLNRTGFQPKQVFFGGRNDRDDRQDLLKDGALPEWIKRGPGQNNWFASPIQGFTLNISGADELYRLTGYPTVQPRLGCLLRLVEPGQESLGVVSLQTADWRNPLSLRLRTTAAGDLVLALPLQNYAQEWATDGFGRNSPNYTGLTRDVPSTTARRCYGIMLSPAEEENQQMLGSLFTWNSRLSAMPLDTIKDWVLEWPDPLAGAAWTNAVSVKGTNALAILRDRVWMKRTLGNLASCSMAYHFGYAKNQYPRILEVLDKPDLITADERREMRRLSAFTACEMNSIETFPLGAGFHLNNPNMTIMALEARAKSSLLVKDHPQFAAWGAWTRECLRDYIRRFTRDSGALYENAHYSLGVTLDDAAMANRILLDAGLGDAFDTDLFHRSIRFMFDWLTPPDPRFLGYRMIAPLGNCSYQSVPPDFGQHLVEYYQPRDPVFAGQIQWFANQTLPDNKKIKLVADVVPSLGSVHYRDYGVAFRHGFGTPYETFLYLYAGNCDGHYEWETDQMSYTLYAKGQPINLHFGNGYFPMFCRPWLRNRVSFNHELEVSERNPTKIIAAAFTPEAEYARACRDVDQLRPVVGEGPALDEKGRWTKEESKNWPAAPVAEDIPLTKWFRQILFLKDPDPKGPNYFVLRDDFGGTPTKPTDLSLWFLANGMTTNGGVYHFDGQCLVDMDVFVHTPADAPLETGRYGHAQQAYVRLVGFDPKYFPGGKLSETQMLLRVRQPAGKGYLVVLYPRLKEGDPAAAFTRVADNVVKVETPLATDYAFLNSNSFEFKDERVQFSGTAATVRFYKSGSIVVAGMEGKSEFRIAGKNFAGTGAFTVTITGDKVETKTFGAGSTVTAP